MRLRVLTLSVNAVLGRTNRGESVMSSDGSLPAAATSPNAVETHLGAFWKPSAGGSLLFEQSRASTSRPLFFAMSATGAAAAATVADGSTDSDAVGSATLDSDAAGSFGSSTPFPAFCAFVSSADEVESAGAVVPPLPFWRPPPWRSPCWFWLELLWWSPGLAAATSQAAGMR